MSEQIRCGDAVRHKPSGQTWLVAYADYENDTLSATGWPESINVLSDCERVRVATDEEHEKHVSEWLDTPHSPDHRPGVVRRLYRPAPQNQVAG